MVLFLIPTPFFITTRLIFLATELATERDTKQRADPTKTIREELRIVTMELRQYKEDNKAAASIFDNLAQVLIPCLFFWLLLLC